MRSHDLLLAGLAENATLPLSWVKSQSLKPYTTNGLHTTECLLSNPESGAIFPVNILLAIGSYTTRPVRLTFSYPF
jgi:hypothetical protein